VLLSALVLRKSSGDVAVILGIVTACERKKSVYLRCDWRNKREGDECGGGQEMRARKTGAIRLRRWCETGVLL